MNHKKIAFIAGVAILMFFTGCAKIVEVKRTVNADGSGFDEVIVKADKTLIGDDSQELIRYTIAVQQIFKDRSVITVNEAGDARMTGTFTDVTKITDKENNEKIIFSKKNDGTFSYEHSLNLNKTVLKSGKNLFGGAMPGGDMEEDEEDDNDKDEDDDEDDQKNAANKLADAFGGQALNMDDESYPKKLILTLVMPGEIKETNANATKGRTATWTFDAEKIKKSKAITLKAVCGAPVKEAEQDLSRFKSLNEKKKVKK